MSTSIGELEGTISLEDQFSDALQLVSRNAGKVFGEMEGLLGTVAIAATAAVTAIAGIAGTITYFGVQGSHLNDLDTGFEKLAGSEENATNILAAMNKGVADTVDSTQLLTFANRALSTGAIKTAQDFGTVTAAARTLSRQGLGDVESNLQAISSAMATGRVRQLQYLVGAIDLKKAETEYAHSIGTTADQLNQAGKIHAAQIAILQRLNDKVTQAGDLQKSFAEKITTARLAVGNWFDDIAKAVAKSPAISNAFDAIGASLVKNFGGGAKTVQETIINWIERFANAAAYYGPIVIDWLKKTFDWITDVWHRVQAAWDSVPDWFKKIALEAGTMAVAVKLAKGALDGIVMGGGGGGSVLGDVASGATIVSGLQSIISLAPTVGKYFKAVGEAASVAGMAVKLAWGAEGAMGALIVVRDLLGGMALEGAAQLLAFLGPVGLAAVGVTALGFAFFEMKKHIDAAGKGLDDLAKHKNADTYINGLKDSTGQLLIHLDEAKQKLDALSGTKPQLLFQGRGLEAHMPGEGGAAAVVPPPSELKPPKDLSKEIAAATKSAIDRTAALWDQYYTLVDNDATDSYNVQIRANQRWFDDLKAKLDEGKALNKDYDNELLALQAVFEAKGTDIVERETMRQLKIRTDAMAAAIEQSLQFPEGAPLQMKPLNIPINVPDIATPMAEAERAITAAMNEAAKSTIPLTDAQKEIIKRMRAVGISAEEMARILGISFEQAANEGMSAADKIKRAFKQSFGDLNGIFQAAFEGGGGIGGAIKSFATNLLGNILDIVPLVGPIIGQFAGAIVAGLTKLFGGPSQKELEGRSVVADFEKQFAGTKDMIEQVGAAYMSNGKTAADASAAIQKLWAAEKQGADATKAALEEINAELEHHNKIVEGAAAFGQTKDQLNEAATLQKQILDYMMELQAQGQVTQDQVDQAFLAYQKALAAAGDATAAAWVKAHDAITPVADDASAAGYQTTEQLDAAAKKAQRIAEYMRDSGKFLASDVEDAFQKARDAADAALGISKKMLDEQKSLQDALKAEAPEAVIGAEEKRNQERLDAINKQIDAQRKAGEESMKAAEQAQTASQYARDGMNSADAAALAASQAQAEASKTNAGTAQEAQKNAEAAGKAAEAAAKGAGDAQKTSTADATADAAAKWTETSGTIKAVLTDAAAVMTQKFKEESATSVKAVEDAFATVVVKIPINFVNDAPPTFDFSAVSVPVSFAYDAVELPKIDDVVTPVHFDYDVVALPTFNDVDVPVHYDYDKVMLPDFGSVTMPVHYQYDSIEMPEGQHAKKEAAGTGGIAFASGPMTFSTKGDEYYAFGGEGKGLAGLFAGSDKSTTAPAQTQQRPPSITLRIDKLQVGKNIALKDIVINELEKAPSKRDVDVVKGLVRAGQR